MLATSNFEPANPIITLYSRNADQPPGQPLKPRQTSGLRLASERGPSPWRPCFLSPRAPISCARDSPKDTRPRERGRRASSRRFRDQRHSIWDHDGSRDILASPPNPSTVVGGVCRFRLCMASFLVLPYAADSIGRVSGHVMNEGRPMAVAVAMRDCKAKTGCLGWISFPPVVPLSKRKRVHLSHLI